MSRILGLDIGTKRIGVAVSDPLNITATPKDYIQNDDKAIEKIKNLLKEYKTKDVVVGLPLTLKGNEGEQVKYTKEFVEKLKENIPDINIIFIDERFSSSLAEKHINPKKLKEKGKLDSLSAAIILQTYLDSLSIR
ncbi:MAG: Holliday junction resolvase RuvX [Hydrogenothermaceae bacterium]